MGEREATFMLVFVSFLYSCLNKSFIKFSLGHLCAGSHVRIVLHRLYIETTPLSEDLCGLAKRAIIYCFGTFNN